VSDNLKGHRHNSSFRVKPDAKPLARGAPLPQRSGKRRKCYQHLTDESFRRWIMGRPCVLRGKPGHVCGESEPAHLDDAGRGSPDKGNIVPICAVGHRLSPKSWHMAGRESFCAHWGITMDDLRQTAKELADWYDGRIEEAF
jgi:hypothetical protein